MLGFKKLQVFCGNVARFSAIFAIWNMMVACQSSQPKVEEAKTQTWAGQMQGLAQEVQELIPYIYSRQAFHDSKNAGKINVGLKKLASQSHTISPEMGKTFFGDDPLVTYSLDHLQSDLSRAAEAFQMGQVEYARGVAKAATNHCFRCHSLTKVGAQAHWDVMKMTSVSMSPLEKVDLIVASRHYEEAIHYLEGLMSDREYIQNFPFEFESSLRKYLSLMIRVENNPKRALEKLNQVLELKEVPFYMAERARAWKKSLSEWKNHKPSKKNHKSPSYRAELVALARRCMARGLELQQFAKDHAGDIEFLRATELLHEYLRWGHNGDSLRAEAYYLLGQAYEVLDELGDWNLHEVYYETCIQIKAHTPLAKKCYSRLESSVYLGFSGSSGIHIPAHEKERLKTLKELAN